MPNQIDTRRMVPLHPDTHAFLKAEVEKRSIGLPKKRTIDSIIREQFNLHPLKEK